MTANDWNEITVIGVSIVCAGYCIYWLWNGGK